MIVKLEYCLSKKTQQPSVDWVEESKQADVLTQTQQVLQHYAASAPGTASVTVHSATTDCTKLTTIESSTIGY